MASSSRRLRVLLASALLAAGSPACGAPEGAADGQLVRTLVYDPTARQFILADRHLETASDLLALQGATTNVRTGARLVFDARKLIEPETCDQFAAEFVREGGGKPALAFLDDDGVLVAEDYDTLMMVTTYYNFELARDFFLDVGVPEADLAGTVTFYEPTVVAYDLKGDRGFEFDNAAYVPCVNAFMVFAGVRLQDIPLGANPGVAAHEYGHLVFDRALYGPDGDATAPPEDLDGDALLRALNEGLADFFGASILGDPNFAARALMPNDSDARDLSPGAVWSAELEAGLPLAFDPYALGTVWASLFWDLSAGLPGGQRGAARLALDALTGMRGVEVQVYRTNAMLAAVARTAPAGDVRQMVCNAIATRFSALPPHVPACAP